MDLYSLDHVFTSCGAFRNGLRRGSDRVEFLASLLVLRGSSSTTSNIKGPLNFISCKNQTKTEKGGPIDIDSAKKK